MLAGYYRDVFAAVIRGNAMQFRAIVFAVIVGLSIMLFVTLRKDNRADAAAGNCYASAQGPSAPTICQ